MYEKKRIFNLKPIIFLILVINLLFLSGINAFAAGPANSVNIVENQVEKISFLDYDEKNTYANSVVEIFVCHVYFTEDYEFKMYLAEGTGFFISDTAIATVAHTLNNGEGEYVDHFYVYFRYYDEKGELKSLKSITYQVVAIDIEHDLAIAVPKEAEGEEIAKK